MMKMMKTVSKTVIAILFVLVISLTYSILIGNFNIRSHFFPILLSNSNATTTPPCYSGSPLRVYMYDMPKRFNVGMLKRPYTDLPPVTADTLPPWPANGLKQQHSVEYWMMASLLYKGNDSDESREAVRVLDPNLADVFFVPFFSSLSFNTHGHNMTDPDTQLDKQLQVYSNLTFPYFY